MTGNLRGLLLAPALLILLALSPDPAPAQGPQTIPSVHGQAFNGATVDLPAALRGKVGVLVLGFSQSSRDQVTDWSKRLSADYRDSSTITYYEMPVLESIPRPLRSLIIGKVKESVPEPARPRCIPILEHEADWRSIAGYRDSNMAYILIVDQNGRVQWKVDGPATNQTYAQVKQRVERMRSGL